MLIIAGHLHVDPGHRDDVVAAFADLLERGRAFEGCLDIAVTADPLDPGALRPAERRRDPDRRGATEPSARSSASLAT